MKLTHKLARFLLAIVFTSSVSAATIPQIKAASPKTPVAPKVCVAHVVTAPKVPVVPHVAVVKVPAVPKVPVAHVITVPKVPVVPHVAVVKVPAVPKIPNAPKVPIVKTPVVPVVKVPAVPKIPNAPKAPIVKTPVVPVVKVPAVRVPATPKIPAIAREIRIPQIRKVPQAAPRIPVVIKAKAPAMPQMRTLASSKRTGNVPVRGATPVIKTVTPARLIGHYKPVVTVHTVKAARLGQELIASGVIAGKKEFVASRVGQFSAVNAPRPVVPDSDSDAQEMAVIPATPGRSDGTDPATRAGEMWTPWWSDATTDPNAVPTDRFKIRDQAGATPREPGKSKQLLYAPNPVKPAAGATPRDPSASKQLLYAPNPVRPAASTSPTQKKK